MELEFSDRYDVLGISRSGAVKFCDGPCEGTGIFPVHRDDTQYHDLWVKAHKKAHSILSVYYSMRCFLKLGNYMLALQSLLDSWHCDGWHFVDCPDCNGKGRFFGNGEADQKLSVVRSSDNL